MKHAEKLCYTLKYTQNFFMQSFPLYTSCLFSTLLDDDIVDIEKQNMFAYFSVDEYSELVLYQSVFSNK